MKKPYNVISKASLVAIFAASAIVPVATASAEAASAEISKVVYELNGELISVTMNDFENAIINGEFDLDLDSIKYVQLNNGKNYSMSDYENALINTDSAEDATQSLAEKTTPADISPLEGSYDKDGNVVAEDETPEEKVNETFFYNLAA